MKTTTTFNPLGSKVSLFDTIKHTSNGISRELKSILLGIKDGEWEKEINQLRTVDPIHRANFKKKLSNFTASGLFESRIDDALTQHSNILVLDLDKLPDVKATKEKVIKDKHSLFAFESCSGNGLAIGIIINGHHHTESFRQLKKYYKTELNLEVDTSCGNVSRTRFVSFDPALYINERAESFNAVIDAETKNKVLTPIVKKITSSGTDESKYKSCVAIINKNKSYVDGEKHHYLFSLVGFLNKVGVTESFALNQVVSDFAGGSKTDSHIESIIRHCYRRTRDFNTYPLKEFIEVPKADNDEDLKAIYRFVNKNNKDGEKWEEKDVVFQSDKYRIDPEVVRNIFKFIYNNNIDEHGMNKKPIIQQVEHHLNKQYDLRFNVVTSQPEYKRKRDKHYKPMDEDSIYRNLRHANIKYPLNQLSSLLRSDLLTEYNPFKEFFEQLPKWDGDTDHIENLSNYVEATNQDFFNTQFKKMLVRCIACAVYNIVNRFVFVFVSEKQELGKSTFIRLLNPFGEKYYTEAPLRENKDSEFRVSENFIYNLEELSSLRNVEVNSLKAIISKAAVKERRPYGKMEVESPRRCNFFGSTNKEEFLTDNVNTRWLCFTIEDINWEYTKNIDIKQVWAQAFTLYKSGFNFELTREEKEVREGENKGFEVRSNESELITKYFKVVNKAVKYAEFMSSADIGLFIQNQEERTLQMNRYAIGRAMSQLGFIGDKQRINGIQIRGYWVDIAARGNTDDESPKGLLIGL